MNTSLVPNDMGQLERLLGNQAQARGYFESAIEVARSENTAYERSAIAQLAQVAQVEL